MRTRSSQRRLLPGENDVPLQSNSDGALGTPDRHDYTVQFRLHCHQLIAFGYERIFGEGHSESDEDFITQRLKETVKAVQRERTLPKWAYRYVFTDQTRVSIPGRVGKERPIIDIEIESTECRSRPVFHFEAKRLRIDDSDSVSEYVGPKGLGMFVTELYGRAGDEGGMLGYVQSKSLKYWANAIECKLRRDGREKHRLADDGTWTVVCLIPVLDHTYVTRHQRPTLGDINIYHTLLNFGVPASRLGESH
jgi:hypothetical protein